MFVPSKPRRKLKVLGPVYVSRLTSDGKYLLTGGQDRTIRLWNPYRPDPEKLIEGEFESILLIKAYSGGHGHEVRDVTVSDDKSKFASCGGDKLAVVWDVATGNIRKLPSHDGRINSCTSNKDFTVVFTASYDGTVKAWDLRAHSRTPIQTFEGSKDSVSAVTLAEDSSDIICGSVDGFLRTYDLRCGMMYEDNLYEPISSISASYDGNCIAASTLGSASIRILERSNGSQLNIYRGHVNSSYPLQCCFSNTDAQVLSGSEDGCICVWDLVSAKLLKRLKFHEKAVCSISYHPKEPMMISSSYDGTGLVFA